MPRKESVARAELLESLTAAKDKLLPVVGLVLIGSAALTLWQYMGSPLRTWRG